MIDRIPGRKAVYVGNTTPPRLHIIDDPELGRREYHTRTLLCDRPVYLDRGSDPSTFPRDLTLPGHVLASQLLALPGTTTIEINQYDFVPTIGLLFSHREMEPNILSILRYIWNCRRIKITREHVQSSIASPSATARP